MIYARNLWNIIYIKYDTKYDIEINHFDDQDDTVILRLSIRNEITRELVKSINYFFSDNLNTKYFTINYG